jgi:hypothetical protein
VLSVRYELNLQMLYNVHIVTMEFALDLGSDALGKANRLLRVASN